MRTTVDIPDAVLGPARVRAAQLGVSLRKFIAEAVTTKVLGPVERSVKPRQKSRAAARPRGGAKSLPHKN